MSSNVEHDIGIEREAVETLLNPRRPIGKPQPAPAKRSVMRDLQVPRLRPGAAAVATGPEVAENPAWSVAASDGAGAAFYQQFWTIAPFVLADLLALASCGWLTGLALEVCSPSAPATISINASPLALLPLCVAFALGGLYSEIWIHPIAESRQMAHIIMMMLSAGAVAGALAWPLSIWCLTAIPVTVALAPLPRMIVRHLLVSRPWWGFPTLVIGAGKGAVDIARLLLEVPRSGLRPVLLTDPSNTCRASMWPVVNHHATLASLLRRNGIRHAVVSLPDCSMTELGKLLDRYSGLVPHLLVMSNTSTLPMLWGASRNGGGIGDFEVRNDLLLATLLHVKRLIDLSLSLLALTIGFPFLLAIGLAVKCTSSGPALFGHERIGRGGRRFKAWKFRTMYPDGERLLREHLQANPAARAEWERDQKLRHDPRVTPVGRLLRRSSLDELPQLWNVLRGDMSLVGPRPIVEDEVLRYGQDYQLYGTVQPGITGLWQVSGRSSLSYADRVRLDVFFVRHWSVWLDVYILAKTVVALFSRRGAY